MAVTPNGGGYWLVAADGGVFNFGNAPFLGSTYTYGITGLTGSKPLNAPITAIVSTPTGDGYWLIAKDGGVFDFGNAPFLGSTYTYGLTGLTGKHPLDAPVIGAIATPSGQGYYMVAADGGVFDFGDAHFEGSAYDLGYTGLGGKNPLPAPVSSLMVNPNGSGYYALCKNGTILAIGGAPSIPAIKTPGSQLVGIMPANPTRPQTPVVPVSPKIPTVPIQPSQPTVPTKPSQPSTPAELYLSGPTTPAATYPLQTDILGLQAKGGNGSYTWSTTSPYFVVNGGEVNPNPSDPPVPGTYNIPVTVTSGSQTVNTTITDNVLPPLANVNSITNVIQNSANATYITITYDQSLIGSGYTFSEADPSWWKANNLSLSSSGTVSGDPTSAISGAEQYVHMLAGGNIVATFPIKITLNQPTTPTIQNTFLTISPGAGASFTGEGGDGTYTYSSSDLPSYLTLTPDGQVTVNQSDLSGLNLLQGPFFPPPSFKLTITSDTLSQTLTAYVQILPVTLEQTQFTASDTASVDQVLSISPTEGGDSPYTFVELNPSTWSADGLSLSSSGVVTGDITQPANSLPLNIDDNGVAVGSERITFAASPDAYTIGSEYYEQNWAGLVGNTNGDSDAISQVGGTFTVPTLSTSQPKICTSQEEGFCQLATWVGLDGASNGSLIQAGVSSIYSSAGTQYQPWYQVIVQGEAMSSETDVNLYRNGVATNVNPGDPVSVNIYKTAAHTWTIVLDDLTTGAISEENNIDFTASVSNSADAENAEWINESPQFNNLSSNFSLCAINPVTTNPCSSADSVLPWISAGGNFTDMTATTTAPFASLDLDAQSTISPNNYTLAANGDGLFTPNLTVGQSYTIGSLSFTQSQESPSASIDAEDAPRSGAPVSPPRVLPN